MAGTGGDALSCDTGSFATLCTVFLRVHERGTTHRFISLPIAAGVWIGIIGCLRVRRVCEAARRTTCKLDDIRFEIELVNQCCDINRDGVEYGLLVGGEGGEGTAETRVAEDEGPMENHLKNLEDVLNWHPSCSSQGMQDDGHEQPSKNVGL